MIFKNLQNADKRKANMKKIPENIVEIKKFSPLFFIILLSLSKIILYVKANKDKVALHKINVNDKIR